MTINLRRHVQKLKLRQKDMAADFGVSEGTMSSWMNRQVHIPPKYLRRMSIVLQLDVADLLPPDDCEAA